MIKNRQIGRVDGNDIRGSSGVIAVCSRALNDAARFRYFPRLPPRNVYRCDRTASGSQAGDSVRAAEAIVEAVERPDRPHDLPLCSAACEDAMAILSELRANYEAWEAVRRDVDFPTVPAGRVA